MLLSDAIFSTKFSKKNLKLKSYIVLTFTLILFTIFKSSSRNQHDDVISRSRIRRHVQDGISDEPGSNQSEVVTSETGSKPVILGFRCDTPKDITDEGELVIRANYPTEVTIFGRHLTGNLSVALTPQAGLPQDDCTHNDRVKSFQLFVKPHTSSVATIIVDMPSPGAKAQLYYLCLRESADTSRWSHQGPHAWLRLYIEAKFLPLYMQIILIALLLALSGLFSGLNLGLMALDKNELQVIISCGSETEKRYARAIEPVRRRGNYLLCSLLFSNVLVNSTIAVLLEDLTSGLVAVFTSTIFIVMFGEILPQAFCSRHGLAVGAKTVFLTYFFMVVTWPLSWPVSFCLDLALGEEIGHVYDRERLMEFIRVTREYNNLETDEVNIISGALKLKRIKVSEVMTRLEDVYMLNMTSVLDFDTIQQIIERGYSRIPVYESDRKNIVALLFAKDLALLDPDDKTPVHTMISFYNHPIMYVFEDATLDLALDEFKTGKSHMAMVRRILDDGENDPYYEIIGVVTLEDVIEEIMQMEINDETDTLSDNRRKRRRKEAQVRKDFSQFSTNLGQGDSGFNVVTPQLCLAAYQYLATTVEPFTYKYISDSILKRLLSQKIYYKCKLDAANAASKRLYTAGEPADYFIMILEGRVHVVCGKESLVFDGGPFNFFGVNALALEKLEPPTITAPEPGLLSNSGSISISMKKLELVVSQADKNEAQQASPNRLVPMKELRASNLSLDKLNGTQAPLQQHFIPDYTVEVVANTSYLKITRNDYLSAYRATLLEREAGGLEPPTTAICAPPDGTPGSESQV